MIIIDFLDGMKPLNAAINISRTRTSDSTHINNAPESVRSSGSKARLNIVTRALITAQ
jgi:hypothetical protein